jgi:hypothetical protein
MTRNISNNGRSIDSQQTRNPIRIRIGIGIGIAIAIIVAIFAIAGGINPDRADASELKAAAQVTVTDPVSVPVPAASVEVGVVVADPVICPVPVEVQVDPPDVTMVVPVVSPVLVVV